MDKDIKKLAEIHYRIKKSLYNVEKGKWKKHSKELKDEVNKIKELRKK